MSTTIESLELEILSSSKSAESGINALTTSLTNLKNATKGGVGLTAVAKQISAVSSAINSINSSTLSNLTGLASAIKSLSGIKVSSTIGKNITSITDAIDKLDIGEFTSKINQMTSAVTPLATQMEKVSNGFNAFSKGANKVSNISGNVVQSNNKSSHSFTDLFHKVKSVSMIVKQIGTVLYSSINKTSEYIENVNLFTVSMGKYANEAKAYAEQVSEIMGIDPGEWMRAQGVFMTLATGFGVSSDKAAIMSKNLTQLGYDISSFYNTDVSDAMAKLKSGLAGELEPLRAIGYDLSQAKLEAIALELGIDKAVSSMTQAEKAQLRYYAIMTQVTTVHGDMARTLEEPANQIRILKAQVEMLVRSIGSVFIPILNKVMPYLIAIAKVLREIISSFATLVGFEMPEVDYSGVDSMASGSEDTASALGEAADEAKKLKSYMLGFDELNVISPDSGASGEDSASGGFDFELPEYDFIGAATNEKVNGIIESVKKLLKPLTDLLDVTKEWAKTLDVTALLDSLKPLFEGLLGIWKEISGVLSWLYTEVVLPIIKWLIESGLPSLINLISQILGAIGQIIKPIAEGLKDLKPVLEPIISWIGEVVITVLESLASIFEELGGVFEDEGGTIKSTIRGIGDVISTIWEILQPLIKTLIPRVKKLLSGLSSVLGALIKSILQVADTIIGDLDGAFETLNKVLSPLIELIDSVFAYVLDEVLAPAFENLSTNVLPKVTGIFMNLWTNVLVPLGELISAVLTPIIQVLSDVLSFLWQNVLTPLIDLISGVFMQAFDGVADILGTVVIPIVRDVIEGLTNLWTGVLAPIVKFLWDDLAPTFKGVFEGIGEIINNFKTIASGIIDFLTGIFSLDLEKAFKGIVNIVVGVLNLIIGAVENIINFVIDSINFFLKGINNVIEGAGSLIGQDWNGIKLIKHVDIQVIPTYAEGGFPESGQAFIARENGIPEMVGTIGRRTAVANNEQIVESVASGVAEANSEQNMLLREQNSLLRALLDKDSGVYLDGRSLSDSVDKYKREHGRVIIAGGVL